MRQLYSIFILFFLAGANLFSQQVTSIECVEEWTIPYPLVTDSLNIKQQTLKPESILTQPMPTTLPYDRLKSSQLQARENGFFHPSPLEKKGQGRLSTFRMHVYTPHYTKYTLKVFGTARLSLFQEETLLGSKEVTSLQDSLPAITKDVVLHAGTSSFYLRTLQLQGDSILPRFSIRFEPTDSTLTPSLGFNPETPKLLSPQYMNSGTFLSKVSLSPSGKYLLATYYTLQDKQYTYYGRVYDSKGNLLREAKELASYKWLPTADRFYFVRKEGKKRVLLTSDALGGEEKIWVASLPEKGTPFVEGKHIFIYQTEDGDTKDPKVQFVRDPDDRQSYWRNRQSLYLIHEGTGSLSPITFGQGRVQLSDVAPDGRLLLIRGYTDWTKHPYYFSDLYLFDPLTAKVDTLIHADLDIRQALFLPDNEQIAVFGSPNSFQGVGNQLGEGKVGNGYEGELFLLSLKTLRATPLTKEFDPSVSSLTTDAKGVLYFSCEEGSKIGIYKWSPAKGIEKIPTSESYIKSFSVAKNSDAIAYIGQSETNADRLKRISPKGERVIWDLDATRMAGYLRPEVREFPFVYNQETSIDAWYYLPPHFDASKKYPLIVYYYGGTSPTQRYMEGRWSLPMYAAQGYVVLTLNPSGTTGYGQEFAARHLNAWGEPTASEIIACVEAFAREHSFINASKIGCFGASYGGFMTQYLVSKTDLFAAAISHAGISSISNYWGSGFWGMGYSTVASYESYPWNRKDIYVEQSPLFRADKINTPLLLLHGDSDTNVPTAESVNLYNALKVLGREVAFITFTKEDHSIQELERKLRWTETMMAWFAKYLQDDPSWWVSLYGKEEK